MSKKVFTIIGLMMMVLLLAMPLYASTDSAHGSPNDGSQAAQTSQHAQPAHNTGQGHQGAVEHVTVKAVPVNLADADTMRILRTDWLKEAQEQHLTTEKAKLSGSFWIVMGLMAALVILSGILLASGAFNRFSLNLKLYSGFGALVFLALVLGVSGYLYLGSMNEYAKLESGFLELDLMASETQVAQDEFLLHGIENKAYGEKQVARNKELTAEFKEDLGTIRGYGSLDAGQNKYLEEVETKIAAYTKDFEEVTTAYHEVEEGKEQMDEFGEKANEALEKMIEHHQAQLAELEAQGTDLGEITYQTRLVEHLSAAEIHFLKAAHSEVEFLLDKHADRVGDMARELGLLKGYLKALESELRTREDKALLQEVEVEIEAFIAILKNVIRDEALIAKDTAEMVELLHGIEAIFFRLSHQAEAAAEGMVREADIALLILVGLALVFGIIISIFLARAITNPINRIVEGLNEGADQVASASGQVSSASQSLAEGSSEQAASIEETSSSLEEMSSMTKQNADNAHQADNLMKEANQVVGKANDSMTDLTGSMEEISKASEETSKIIKTIDEIAFQTNLLALNAAVEAARAGEAGAGFAVVADEVRNLAMRAADAAKNTAELIEGTVKKVNEGGELVSTTNEAFTEVADSSAKVGELVGEIAAASNEQAEGIEQVNKAVVEMDKVVQQNAANAEESASASEEMNAQAVQMKGFVDDLVGLLNGSSAAVQSVSRTHVTAPTATTRGVRPAPAQRVASKAVAVRKTGEVSPEQVIPMADEDFKDF